MPDLNEAALISLVVSTRGRTSAIGALLASLERQTYRNFEIIIVDQNQDDRLAAYLATLACSLPVKHIHRPDDTGLSRGRNVGAREASGSIIIFPDDDCWYPPQFLALGAARLAQGSGVDVIAGKAADEQGRDINGRYESRACRIDRVNVWTTGIEWVVFFKTEVFRSLEGYDVEIGVGASTPWQSCEGQDLMLRALERGFACHYDPALFGHHAEFDTAHPDRSMCVKGRMYGRGLGYVLSVHDFKARDAAKWIVRPAVKALLVLAAGQAGRFRYYVNVSLGRLEGWSNRVYSS